MAKHLTLEDIIDAIRVKRTSIRGVEIRQCLSDAGFKQAKRSGSNSSHEHWNHPCGASLGLVNASHKDSINFDILENVRDALIRVREWEQNKSAVVSELPSWADGELCAKDGLSLVQSERDQTIVLMIDAQYPECAVAIPLAELDKGRYLSALQKLKADVGIHKESLDALRPLDIRRELDFDGKPQLRVNGSGFLPLPSIMDMEGDAMRINQAIDDRRFAALTQAAIMTPVDEETLKASTEKVQKAMHIIRELGADLREVEGYLVVDVPEYLRERFGKNHIVRPLSMTVGCAEKFLGAAYDLRDAHKEQRDRQVEVFQDLMAYGCEVDTASNRDQVVVKLRSGEQTVFERDVAGCVDFHALRALAHEVRDTSWAARMLKGGEVAKSALRS